MTQNPDPNQPPPAPPAQAPPKPARTVLIALLGGAIVLLLGIVIGMLIADANRDGGTAAVPTGDAASSPAVTPSTDPTVSEEELQEVLDMIRAQPRRDAEDPYAVGEVDAPVVLIEYADYRCSYCGRWTLETKPGLMDQVEDGTLRIEWRDFPVFQNESVELAVAARAAAQQGMFWEYNDAIFEYQFVDGNQDFTAEALISLAEDVGVPDLARFGEDLGSEELRAEVQAEYEESLALLGQASTPQFLVNDQYIGGALPLEDFLAVIEQELAKL
ncbi:MAG: DsbA family protein [Actinomycetota bacterium]